MSARSRALVSAICLVLGLLLLPFATAGWWVRETVTDTSSYVDTVAPLAQDPAVQAAVERRLTDAVVQGIESQHFLDKATAALQKQGVPPAVTEALTLLGGPIRTQLESAVARVVTKLVTSPEFAVAWRSSNEAAHQQLIAILSGDSSAISVSPNATVSVKLATLTTTIRQDLVNAGVPFADKIPTVNASFAIGKAENLQKAQRGYTLLRHGGVVLPILVVILLIAGLALARDRRKAVTRTAMGAILGMLFLAVSLVVGRSYGLGSLPPTAPLPAAGAVFDTVVLPLRHLMRGIGLIAVIALVVAVLMGPSAMAVSVRSGTRTGWAKSNEALEQRPWLRAVAGGVAVLIVLVLLLSGGLGVVTTIVLALVAVLGVVLAVRRTA